MFFLRNHLQILRSVISLIFIDMMNFLIILKGTPKNLFHNVAMFVNPNAINIYANIFARMLLWLRLGFAHARIRAILSYPFARWGDKKLLSADLTSDRNLSVIVCWLALDSCESLFFPCRSGYISKACAGTATDIVAANTPFRHTERLLTVFA